jgi:hypothetical protein
MAVKRGRHALQQLLGAGKQQPALRSRLGLPRQRFHDLCLRLGPDAGDGTEPARRHRFAELFGSAHPERPRDLDRAPGPESEIAAEPDEAGRELAFEFRQFRDLAGLQQLAQPCLDARADPTQLPHPPGPHELGDGEARSANQVGGAAVGPHRVGVRIGEFQQGGERIQAVGDLRVVHPTKCSRPPIGAPRA